MQKEDYIDILANDKSTILEKTRKNKENGEKYKTYYISISADEFFPYSGSLKLLSATVRQYSKAVYNRTLSMVNETSCPHDYIIMDEKHIHDETMAHLLPWFIFARKLGSGVFYRSCNVVDLNIDEKRLPVKILMKIGSMF